MSSPLSWLCVPFLLLNPISTNIAHTAFNHTFQEPWLGTLELDEVWKWIHDFLMLVRLQWVIRVTVVGLVGACISFSTNSPLVLWLLGADVSYTLILPHLGTVLFFKVTHGYGAAAGCIIGLTARILLGENVMGLPVVLRLPGCILEDGVYVQRSPVRTVSMLSTLVAILVFSWLAGLLLDRGLVPERWDVFKVKRKVDVFPVDPVKRTLKKEREEAVTRTDMELLYSQ